MLNITQQQPEDVTKQIVQMRLSLNKERLKITYWSPNIINVIANAIQIIDTKNKHVTS